MNYANPVMDGAIASGVPAEVDNMTEATKFNLRRPGARPISFSGTELAMAMNFTPELPFWYEINIYRTIEHQFALCIRLFYQSTEEADKVQSWIYDSLPEVFDAVEAYDAAGDVTCRLPDSEGVSAAEMASWAMETRARVTAQRMNYQSLVGELFEELQSAGVYAG